MKQYFVFLLLLLTFPICAKESISCFPLKNESNNKTLNWIGYSFTEMLFRKMSELTDIQIWDPIFLFTTDSSGWKLESDSLLLLHQKRWKWNLALGGSYTAENDSINVTIKIYKYSKNSFQIKNQMYKGGVQFIINKFSDIPVDLLKELNINISNRRSEIKRENAEKNLKIYATYAMGYGYEMLSKINNAISAYNYVIDMDESYAPALHRIGVLYNLCRNRKEARYYLERAVSKRPNSSIFAAEMAEFLIFDDTPEKAISFIDSKRNLLEKTARGMKTIGMAYILTGEYQRAVSALSQALASGQSDLEIEFMLGRSFLFLGQYSTAIEIFGRLTTYRPNYIRYYSYLGQAYREGGQLMESCNVLENAMLLEPDNIPNLINLSTSYFKLGWYEKAEQYLLRAQDLEPDLGEIYINLGVLYWHTNRKEKAKKLFDRALKEKMPVQSALSNKGNILFLTDNIKSAIKAYKKADKIGKKSEITLYNLAVAFLALGKQKSAMKYLDEVLLLSPDRLDVLIMQAQLSSENKLHEKAELFYRKILELSPGHRKAMEQLITLFEKQSRFKEAIQIVEGYLSDFPQDREYTLRLPDLYRQMGWYEVALSDYLKILSANIYQNDYRAYLGLGKCQFDIIRFKNGKDFEQAIYNLKKAIQLNADIYEPDLLIGTIYKKYKKYNELAIDHWEKAYNKSKDPEKRKEIRELITEAQK
ncbi:MAG: tetratricopeptide repeat protein [Chitinispirillia bacterium]|jgi:tetratricopeptide (TPR) repeat protein